jgi:ribonuclease P protein component
MPGSARFPKSARLLKHADFQHVYEQGRRQFSANMTLFYLPRTDSAAQAPRVGFTVSRALGGAVTRNRIRRRVREAVRRHLATLTPAVDVVINPKKSAMRADFAALEREVASAFAAIGRAQEDRA